MEELGTRKVIIYGKNGNILKRVSVVTDGSIERLAVDAPFVPFETLIFGSKDVTTAGTAVRVVASSIKTESITIKAKASNDDDDLIYVGDSTVDSTNGFQLAPGESVSIDIDVDTLPIFIDADTDGDGVTFIGGRL